MKKRLLIACLVLLSAVSTTHAYVEVKDNLIVPLDDRAVREAIFKAQLAKVNQQNVLLRYELVRAQYDGQAVSGDFHSNDSSYDTNNIKELAMIYQYNVTKQMNGAINSKMNARFAYREVPLRMVSPYMKAKNHVPLVLTNPVSVKMYRTRYEKAQADEIADKQYIWKLRKEERKRIVATASSKNGDTGELLADIESLKQNEILKNSLPIQ